MKRILIALVAFALVVPAFAGGGAEEQVYKTTYNTEVKTLNYFLLLDTTALRVAANTMDGLVENDRFGRFVPSLAESWESNADFTQWTFTIRPGVKWVDSTGAETDYEVTADDFVEGLRYVAEPNNGIKNVGIIRKVISGLNGYYWDLVDIDDGVDVGRTREEVEASFDTDVGVEALDKYTVRYTLEGPTPFFLSYLVTELFFPVEKAFLDTVGPEDFGTTKEKLLYNGGYYLADWQRDKQITLVKNDHYWDKSHITVPEVSLQKVADNAIEIQMFQRGEISSTSLQGDQVKALQGTRWQDYVYMGEKSSVTFWFAMNFTSDNPEWRAFVNNDNFRKALYYGIDRAKLISLTNPYAPEALLRNTIIPEDVVIDDKGVDYTDYPPLAEVKARQTYNPDLAREYMAKAIAELTDGNGNIIGVEPTTLDMLPVAQVDIDGKLPAQFVYVHSTDSNDTKEALLLGEMLKSVFGADTIELVSGQYVDDKYNDTIKPRRFDFLYDSFSFKYADPMAQLGRLVTDGSVNDGQYSDPTFDEMVYAAADTNDLQSRYAQFAQAERRMIDQVYVIPWRVGGGSYTMSKIVPFTYPRGGFGVTRFKYKGMILEDQPITAARYQELERQFKADMAAALGN